MTELHLNIADHTTTILIGKNLTEKLQSLKDPVLLVDQNVFKLHADRFTRFTTITVPSGEKHKTLECVEELHRKLIEAEVDRSSMIVGVGGGLATDVAGFVASTYMRGISFGFISSTLLGQVDASIGGKNGVNLDGYKNMVGTFQQPLFVWNDLALLDTLDQAELISGLAEVVKYGAIRNAALMDYIEEKKKDILELESSSMEHIVKQSAQIKISIVEADVHESGERKLLNFGHTLGHAIEKLSGMLHGEAVSIGMVLAARISVRLGFLESREADRLEQILKDLGLPVSTSIEKDQIFDTLLKDKKRSGKNIHFILLKELGEAFIHELSLEELKELFHDLY